MVKKYNLILASKSPRRKELLGHLNLPFEVITMDTAEESDALLPSDFAIEIASKKGAAVFLNVQKRDEYGKSFFPLIVAADTIVVLGKNIFGKPSNREEAENTLLALSAKTHKVITGVDVRFLKFDGNESSFSFFCETEVTFSKITEDVLRVYLDSGESMDKAGAYGIQGAGLTFIENVSGSYSNVVGFPLSHFINELSSHVGSNWRNSFHGYAKNN